MKAKHLPNALTLSRIVLSAVLFFLDCRSALFLALYLLCGLTDVLDGYLARRLHAQSDVGARLDTAADVVFTALIVVTCLRLFPVTAPVLLCVIAAFVLRISSLLVCKLRFHQFAGVHTWGNKLTGLLLFFLPAAYPFLGDVFLWLVCACAVLSALEELLIVLFTKKLDLDCKSIFQK